MLIRALIVVLLMLNVGVATWWLSRPAPETVAASDLPDMPDVPRLRIAPEQEIAGAGADAVAPVVAPPRVALSHCASYGPFANAEAAVAAHQRIRPLAMRVRPRTEVAGPYRGWKVWLPPYASLEEVEAVAARVAAAGFNDRFIVREGRDANSLALGRFAAESAARQHAARLVAAGFPARAEPVGTGPVAHWLDVAASADDAARVISLAGAPQVRELDCATLQ